jgi:REP element-mobilizing transposase RayT
MPYRKFLFSAGQYFHIYNRGNNYGKIFFERENYLYFLRLMRDHIPPEKTEINAYCLMPTHYHILGYTKSDDLSKQMQSFLLAYTKAINIRHERVGALFQGRFKAKMVTSNEVLLLLSRYIHLNPVAASLVSKAEDWEFSSYRDYLGLRNGTLPKSDVILNQFISSEAYRSFVESIVPNSPDDFNDFLLD